VTWFEEKLTAYLEGAIQFEDLKRLLMEHAWRPLEERPTGANVEMWVDGLADSYEDSWAEVSAAFLHGTLTEEEYDALSDALTEKVDAGSI
jgi:hypothetical protein